MNCHDIWVTQDLGHRMCSELPNHALISTMYTCLLGKRAVHDIYIGLCSLGMWNPEQTENEKQKWYRQIKREKENINQNPMRSRLPGHGKKEFTFLFFFFICWPLVDLLSMIPIQAEGTFLFMGNVWFYPKSSQPSHTSNFPQKYLTPKCP